MCEPWKCPDCSEWQAPATRAHRFDAAAEVAAQPDVPAAVTPPKYSGHNGGSFERTGQAANWRPLGFGLRP